MNDTTDILKELPKSTPLWAVGLTSVIVAITVSVVTIYVATKGELTSYIEHRNTLQDKKQDIESSTIITVLNLAQSNVKQIANLSENLIKAQNDNLSLTQRVGALETKVAEATSSLKSCQAELELCKKR
jgi:uncharacterized membrane protein (DUF106 family)